MAQRVAMIRASQQSFSFGRALSNMGRSHIFIPVLVTHKSLRQLLQKANLSTRLVRPAFVQYDQRDWVISSAKQLQASARERQRRLVTAAKAEALPGRSGFVYAARCGALFGVSVESLIRLKTKDGLTPLKLSTRPGGMVLYRAAEILGLAGAASTKSGLGSGAAEARAEKSRSGLRPSSYQNRPVDESAPLDNGGTP